ncbi:BatA domain-containing protein [Fimbriiglobus ruber]|uniref:VWFA domain-containing protein n=1 Tax=Fimbriiglobus ruber TaxID=1908690 RepID=A0A225E7E3_9BACT|nr:BatA domain-containing protein [Fimbriiglobus ruber]OWK46708.1 hypothetical protein FRUB_00407 [Fimbriiglobus ruber]
MSFLAPLMLLGATAVTIPVVLHFFYKTRYRKLPWGAMRFLKQSIEQTSRRLKFQEYILLALRCLCLLLLAGALARPSCTTFHTGGRGESVDAVFVFDTSFSMGARDGEVTRLDRAKQAAQTIIDNLPPNSTVQIYASADRSSFLGPVTPGNLDQARQVVQTIELTSQAGDALPGLAEAYAALDRGAGSNKEVYLFTDLQKTGWDQQAAAVRAKAAEIKQRATLVVVRCGSQDRPINNVAIVDITYPGGIPHTGSRLPVTVLLKNTGKNPVRNLSVTLDVDGKHGDKESNTVDEIPPGQTFPAQLTAKLDTAGAVLLTAKVTQDDLPGDNQLDRLIPVRDRIRVLVVDGAPDPRDPKQSAGHFLRNALLPVPANQIDDYFVKVTVVPVEEAGPGLLGVNDIVFLCNVAASPADRPGVPGLSAEFVERLGTFVKDGGSLVIGTGDNFVASRYNAILGSGGAHLLPFDVEEVVGTLPETPSHPAPDTADPASYLARFRDDPFRTASANVDVFRFVGINDADKPNGRVLMRLSYQKPWITSRNVGDGEVVFVSTSLDASWTNWCANSGSYVSFVQLTLSYLTGKATRGVNVVAGGPLVWHPVEARHGFEIVRPDGKRVKLGKATGGDGGAKLTVNYADTGVAGLYHMGVEGEDPPIGPRFAVVPDLRESDNLDSLNDAEAEQVIGFKPVLVLAGVDGDNALTSERNRREWTIWVLLGLFFVACGEAGWAWVCGRAW